MTIFVANPLMIHLLKTLIVSVGLQPVSNCGIFMKIVLPFASSALVLVICMLIDKVIKLVRLNKILI